MKCAAQKNRDITLVFVFDGLRPKPKETTAKVRRAAAEKARDELARVLAGGDKMRVNDVKRLRKAAASVLEDVVAGGVAYLRRARVRGLRCEIVGAPYESDWQLAYFEYTGYTVGTMTEDSDLFLFRIYPTFLGIKGGLRAVANSAASHGCHLCALSALLCHSLPACASGASSNVAAAD